MKNKLMLAAFVCAGLAPTLAQADDVSFGFGVTYVLGGATNSIAIGPRIFSSQDQEDTVASIGIDYIVNDASWRPSIGVGYLFNHMAYADVTIGYNLKHKAIDFGVGAGSSDSKQEKPNVVDSSDKEPPREEEYNPR